MANPLVEAEDAVAASLGRLHLAFNYLETRLLHHIRGVLEFEHFLRLGGGKSSFFTAKNDSVVEDLVSRRFQHFCLLVGKLDQKRRYVNELGVVRIDFEHAATVRNQLTHGNLRINARRHPLVEIHVVADVGRRKDKDIYTGDKLPEVSYVIDVSEIDQISRMVGAVQMYIFWLTAELAYDYGVGMRDEKPQFLPYQPNLWPHSVHPLGQYPWLLDSPSTRTAEA